MLKTRIIPCLDVKDGAMAGPNFDETVKLAEAITTPGRYQLGAGYCAL